MEYKTTDLKENQLNIKIYGDDCLSDDFIKSIKEKGILAPLTIKNDNTIISGHRRFKAAKLLDMKEVPVEIIDIDNELDEKEMIINFNKQREKTYSQKYNEAKELEIIESKKAKLRQIENLKKGSGQNVCSDSKNSNERNKDRQHDTKNVNNKAKQIVAKQTGFGSEDTLRKYEKIKEADKPDLIEKLDKGEITINKAYENIKNPHVINNSGDNEWYTPEKYILSAKKTMGSINLDPATSIEANKIVKAIHIFTKEDNGLNKAWFGNVWLNPPYSSELISKFVDKIINELNNINQLILLTNNATDTIWFQKIFEYSNAFCFPKGRIKFYKINSDKCSPLQGQCFLYFGKHKANFCKEFGQYGISR